MRTGGKNLLIPNPRDIPAFVKELGKHKFGVFPAVNTLFNGLLNNEEFKKLDFKSLILSLGGGMAVQKAVAEKWLKMTGYPDLRSLWFVGDFTGRHLQPNRYNEVHRLHRAADAVDRHRAFSMTTASDCRSEASARSRFAGRR